MYRRICIWGGPCSGKSVLAAQIFAHMKIQKYNIEMVREFAKELAYQKVDVTPYMQLNIFSEQINREYMILSSNPDIMIVTDAPVALSIPYSVKYGFKNCQQLMDIANSFENDFPSINIMLERDGNTYQQEGRWETLEEAKLMDYLIREIIFDKDGGLNASNWIHIGYNQLEKAIEHIETVFAVTKGLSPL
jgi:nicotinamide riboside kinase